MLHVASKDKTLRSLVPDYIETLAAFISTINEVKIL